MRVETERQDRIFRAVGKVRDGQTRASLYRLACVLASAPRARGGQLLLGEPRRAAGVARVAELEETSPPPWVYG